MDGKITMFGAVDRKGNQIDGDIMSTEPAWSLENQVEDLKEQIKSQEGRISRGEVPPQEVENAKTELKRFKTRYDEIIDSKPKITGKDKDELVAFTTDLEVKISESMPTYEKEMRGHVDPQDEFKRLHRPSIKVNPEMAHAFGVETDSRGRITGNDAAKIWKIARRFMNESSFSEALRRDK